MPKSEKMNVDIYFAHSDDLAYSATLFLDSLKASDSACSTVHAIYVFSVTDHAPNLNDCTISQVIRIRSGEAESSCKALGVTMRVLGLPDACVRKDYLGKEVCHQEPLTATDQTLVRNIFSQRRPADLVAFPLALGDHIDHRILRDAGLLHAKKGHCVIFYEDLPYAYECTDVYIESRIEELSRQIGRNPEKELIHQADFESTLPTAASIHHSQVSQRYIEEILAYNRRRMQTDGGHARLWRI